MDREKLFLLINLALDIQEHGEGADGHPYVSVSIENYGYNVKISIMDDGFRVHAPYDGCYGFDFAKGISQRQYNACKGHLEELKAKITASNKED